MNRTIWVLIVVSILLVPLELLAAEAPQALMVIRVADLAVLGVFALELFLRVLTFRPAELDLYDDGWLGAARIQVLGRVRYLLRPMTLIDLLTVVAVYPPLRALRAARLLRLLRTGRIFRYSNPFKGLVQGLRDNAPLYSLAFSLLGTLVLIGGLSMYAAEIGSNEDMDSVGDGLWWGLVTVTTVGFGDIAPVTPVGRVIGGVLMVSGMFMLALFAGIVGQTLVHSVMSLRQEVVRMSGLVNHIVVLGYDPGVRMLFDALEEEMDVSEVDVVVFADRERPRHLPPDFQWVRGDPTKQSELDKVRLGKAAAAIVVGARDASPQEADATTILTLFTVRSYLGMQPDLGRRKQPVYLVAEILDVENVAHARTAGANEVIETTRIGFSLLAHAIREHGTATILSEVVAAGAHNVYIGRRPDDLEGIVAFSEASTMVKRKTGAMVIGLRITTSGETVLNPPDTRRVQVSDHLVYLAERPVLRAP